MSTSRNPLVVAFLASAGVVSSALGGLVVTGSSGNLAAEAEFTVSGSTLTIRLTNTSIHDCLVPADVLTALFFDIAGGAITLTPVSASLSGGSFVFGGPDGGGNVGGEWGYAAPISGIFGTDYGISSAGFGLFGGANFNGPDLDPPAGVNGLNYGIVSAGDNIVTGNGGMARPLIKNEVTFVLSGLPSGFDENRINNVWFQYGTALDEPSFNPAPGSAALLGLAGLFASRRRR